MQVYGWSGAHNPAGGGGGGGGLNGKDLLKLHE